MRQTPLRRTTRLSPISLNKVIQLNSEVPDRIALCNRAGGHAVLKENTYRLKGTAYHVTTVFCQDAVCECGCGERAEFTEPHEKIFRSQGGKLSLDNSIMVKRGHHPRLQNNELHFTKSDPACLGDMV